MRGFILNIIKAKNEDVIVTVLSKNSVQNYYRFFGTRHSILQIGNLIDFEVQDDNGSFLPKIRRISHLGFPWLFLPNHLLIWQNFIQLFNPHLKETTHIESFYFDLLLSIAQKWHRQNPKRLAVEAYLKLLLYEKRLHKNNFCYICEETLDNKISLMRAYIPAHSSCIYSDNYEKNKIFQLFDTQCTIKLKDDIVNNLYIILLKGL